MDPNWEKSKLLPTQEFTFIGMPCNLRLGLAFPPMNRREKIQKGHPPIQGSHSSHMATPDRPVSIIRKAGTLREDPHERHPGALHLSGRSRGNL